MNANWIFGFPSCWCLGTWPPKAADPHENSHTQAHMLRIPPVTGLRHPVCGSQIPQSTIASCMMKHTCNWVSQPIPRPHSTSSSWLQPLGSSRSQLINLCGLSGFPGHLPYSLSGLAWLMLVIASWYSINNHTICTGRCLPGCWHPMHTGPFWSMVQIQWHLHLHTQKTEYFPLPRKIFKNRA